jgi:co-chaperonin GroES (HSP10)
MPLTAPLGDRILVKEQLRKRRLLGIILPEMASKNLNEGKL